jgi:transposase
MPQLTEIQKQLITQRFANGISVRAIANEMHVSKNTIQLAKQKIRDFGNITRRPGTGRPKTTTVDDDLALVNVLRLNPFQSAIRARQQSNFPASLKTARRRIRQTELKNRCAANNSILSIKNGNDNVRIEDNCLEEELATTPILSEIRTLSLTFVMLMRFFARLNIYYKTFLTAMRYDALHIVLPQCRFLYRVSKAICKQLPPLQFLCANIASCVEKQAVK